MKLSREYLTALFLALGLILMGGCTVASGQKSAGEFVDDSVISTQVKTALIKDDTVRASEINVETYKGEVQLTGYVSSRAAANRAVELTRQIKGVTSVRDDMQIR
ncbi:BON domain-containing protein [Pseudomonas sp. gcc21]|uniref:BON domain-containing protein n=1 Tax=Pseudomonas sp. gcc21 TaxID=2726989 RepID=UPI0014517BC7|nr:BON domain-containing protein [Pseudomonas sp. gcc21]QJD58899.1 BON domain-containing protein [Pseudomonas sp. gcc21]